ncbi:DNA alkylation repair protein [Kordiimonas aquimaris]|uniref:DNA alkylation repair protein n=1 Tax=Kordiimonas aquimaris TaxID=707591 RepID=UPI0021D2E4B0|nr:DNA alkylation repair protein [Kordiimonas aquimaris]
MEPFKELMNADVARMLGAIIKTKYAAFNQDQYEMHAMNGLASLEFKDRVMQVADAFDATLPQDFDTFAEIMLNCLHPSEDTNADGIKFGPDGVCGFAIWPLTELVTIRGINEPEKAFAVLKEQTKRFSSEFAVRPLIAKYPEIAMETLMKWADDENRHVRRLASEGSRPRLPWGIRLDQFVNDPAPLLPLLEKLKDDPDEYVRRSVANNLNDIAKDHPAVVANIAEAWLKNASKNRHRLVKHACRTLIKSGDQRVLSAFGYKAVKLNQVSFEILTPTVKYGDEALEFELVISSDGKPTNLMIDYAVHFMKANGSLAPKVFKWKDLKGFEDKQLKAQRKHAIKPITTRVYYPGKHKVEIFINGVSAAIADFELQM